MILASLNEILLYAIFLLLGLMYLFYIGSTVWGVVVGEHKLNKYNRRECAGTLVALAALIGLGMAGHIWIGIILYYLIWGTVWYLNKRRKKEEYELTKLPPEETK